MAVNDYGDHGEPIISNPPTTAADMTAIITYARNVGNRVVGTYAQLTSGFVAAFGSDPWDGLEGYATDSGKTLIYNARTGQWVDHDDSGSVNSGGIFTPASGWAYDSDNISYSLSNGGLLQVYVSFYRTGGTINVPSDGNITNVTVGSIALPPRFVYPAASGSAGRIAHFTIASSGSVQLTAVTPGTNIQSGDDFSFGGTYIYR